MKKVIISSVAMLLSILVYAQPVSDNATIPVSVSVNSILRLHVTTGGNIEFVFNTIEQMKEGIGNTAATTTTFTVASSQAFDVELYAEGDLLGTDNNTNTLLANKIGYLVASSGANTPTTYHSILTSLTTTAGTECIDNCPAGDVADNAFSIKWECATAGLATAGGGAQGVLGIAPDRYATNVFLILAIHD